MKKDLKTALLIIGILVISQQLKAFDSNQYAGLSLEDLLKIKVITVSKRAESVRDAPGMISVISHDEIERFGGTTLADILNRVPGLINVSSYYDRSMMAARGDSVRYTVTNRHVLLLIDGRPLREVQEGGMKSGVYEAFPINAIDHIEVIKGPGSVLYGSEAFSAVINIITARVESTSASVAGATSTEGSSYVLAKAAVERNDLSFLVAARLAERDDWPFEYFFSNVPNAPGASSSLANFSDRTEGVFLRSEYKNLRLTGSLTEYKTNYVVPHTGQSSGEIRYKKLFLDSSYAQDISDGWSMTASLTYNRSWFDAFATRDSEELIGEITSFSDISDKIRLTIGGLIGRIEGTELAGFSPDGSTANVVTDGSRSNWAAYAQVDYQLVDTAKLIGGFQALKYENIDLSVVPRLGLVWNPSQRFNIKALYAEAFRAPYINENFIDFPGVIAGNPMLKPEMVESYELGVSYIRDTIEMTIGYFDNTQSDLISFAFAPDSDSLQYFNVAGELEIEGLEFELKYYVNSSLFLSGSLLSQRMADHELTGISNFGAKAGVSYSGEIGTISLFDIYQGSISKELYDPSSLNPKPGSYNLLYLHAHLDLMKLLKRDTDTELKLFLQGDNLLGDEELWVPSSGGAVPASLPFKRGRDVYAGFEVIL